MKTRFTLFQSATWVLAAAVIFVAHAAQACPGCKQNVVDGKTTLNDTSVGFGLGVLFMIGMVVSVLGMLGYMMYRYSRVIAAQQQAAMAQEDALHGLA